MTAVVIFEGLGISMIFLGVIPFVEPFIQYWAMTSCTAFQWTAYAMVIVDHYCCEYHHWSDRMLLDQS